MKLQQTQSHCIDTQPRRNGSWYESLIDESFRLLVCSIYLHVCIYRLSPLLVLPTNIIVTSPGQIKLGQCKTTRITCRRFGGVHREIYSTGLLLLSSSHKLRLLTFLVLSFHRVLTWIFPDFLSNTCYHYFQTLPSTNA